MKEWTIQRCTGWIKGTTQLSYEPWPQVGPAPMTRAQMLQALERCARRWPDQEFRGHNVGYPGHRSINHDT